MPEIAFSADFSQDYVVFDFFQNVLEVENKLDFGGAPISRIQYKNEGLL